MVADFSVTGLTITTKTFSQTEAQQMYHPVKLAGRDDLLDAA